MDKVCYFTNIVRKDNYKEKNKQIKKSCAILSKDGDTDSVIQLHYIVIFFLDLIDF